MKELCWLDLGLVPYQEAWDLQRFLVDQKKTDPFFPEVLILLEHPPVLTLGRWGRAENVLIDPDRLRRLGIDLVRCERGGQVTYHGPGQLVGYPVLNLKALCLGIKEYVFLLEEVLIGLLKEYDLPAGRRTGYPGVWVEQEKIASLGLSVQEGIAFHGFALNYRVDLEPFQWIIPCGLSGVRMTSMDRLKGGPIEAKDLRRRLAAHFEEIFNLKPVSGELEKRIVKKWLENCKKIPISSFDGNNQRDRQESENVVSHHSG